MQTDSSFQKDLKTYKNEIKSKLICDSKVSKKFIEDLQNNIDNYIADNNVTSIEEIYRHFGSADDIAKAFFETTDINTVKRKISIKKFVVILMVVVISIWVVVTAIDLIGSREATVSHEVVNGIIDESEYSIMEE